jgi:hypothetical protein
MAQPWVYKQPLAFLKAQRAGTQFFAAQCLNQLPTHDRVTAHWALGKNISHCIPMAAPWAIEFVPFGAFC